MLCSKNILMTTESTPCIKRIVPFFLKEYILAFFLFIILFNFDQHDIVMYGLFPKNPFLGGLILAVIHGRTFRIYITSSLCSEKFETCIKSIVNFVKSLCMRIVLWTIQTLLSIKAARQPKIYHHNSQLLMTETNNRERDVFIE